MKQHFKHFYVLLASLLLIFASYMSVQAAEEDAKQPTIIPLAYEEVQSGSFSANESAKVYYLITITQKQSITVYGSQTAGKYVSLHLYDQDMKYVTHKSTVTTNATYTWKIDNLEPGSYYICASSHYTAIEYTIAYTLTPDTSNTDNSNTTNSNSNSSNKYADAIPLERAKKVSGKVTSEHDENIYKIVLTAPLTITFNCTKDEGPYLSLELYDEKGKYVDHMSIVREEATFSWTPDEKLSAGTYYLSVSRRTDVNYTISWQIKGPSAVGNLRAAKKTTSMITLKWKKSPGASKYIVYTYNTKKKAYKKYKTVTSNTCKVKKLKIATKYKFKVVPVMTYGSEQIMGDEEIIETATTPKKVNAPTITYHSSGTLSGVPVNYYTVKWKNVKGATGYEVYVKAHGTKGWKEAGITKSTSTTLYVVKGYSAQVKVRAYIYSNGGDYSYGAFSSVKTIKSR